MASSGIGQAKRAPTGADPDPEGNKQKHIFLNEDLRVSLRRNARVHTTPQAKSSLFLKIAAACTPNVVLHKDRARASPVFVKNVVWCTRHGDFKKKRCFRLRFGLHSCVLPQRNIEICYTNLKFFVCRPGSGYAPIWARFDLPTPIS